MPRSATAVERIAARLRAVLPDPVRSGLRSMRRLTGRFSKRPAGCVDLENEYPWTSPNVWSRVVNAYVRRPSPTVGEYGTGASSLHHLRNLLPLGGSYVGVEHDLEWYSRVVAAMLRFGMRSGTLHGVDSRRTAESVSGWISWDTVMAFQGARGRSCHAFLKLRHSTTCPDAGGATAEEYRHYVRALGEPCDVVIVDGAARKACINYLLDSGLVKQGGMIALFEAGRGMESWLGRPTLSGTRDYQPEVRRMLALGGEVLNGEGVDRWPGIKHRRTASVEAYRYPAEACLLHVS